MRAIIAPLHEEIKLLQAHLELDTTIYLQPGTIWHGKLGPHEVCLVRTGPGETAVHTACAYCFQTFPIEAALLIGFGGGTTPTLHPGDLVIAAALQAAGANAATTSAPTILDQARAICQQRGLSGHTGTMVITDTMICTPHEKAFLGTQHEAIMVAQEGIRFAHAAQAHNIPWTVVRSIFDPMDMAYPEGFTPVDEDGTLAVGNLMRCLLHSPRIIGKLSQFHFAATKGRDALTTFAKGWLSQ